MRNFITLIAMLFFLSCGSDPLTERAQRSRDADADQDDIVIGIVSTSAAPDLFLEGVNLAIKELNQEKSVLGRTFSPIYYDDEGSPEKGLAISEQLARNPDLVAVVGHINSDSAIRASITYEKNGIVFISPGATEPALTRYGGKFTFRNIPSDEETGREMAELASYREFKKIVILYDRGSSEGRRLAGIFEDEAAQRGIRIVVAKSYFSWQEDILVLLSDIAKKYEFDAIFLGGVIPSGANIIKQLRDMGVTVPILGSGLFDSSELSIIAGKAADGTIVPTVFDPRRSSSRAEVYVRNFKSEFGVLPDTGAAQGYDAIQVLASAMRKSGSTIPISVSTVLRSLEGWRGVTGKYSFTADGDIMGKAIFFKEMHAGNFEFIQGPLKKEEDMFDLIRSTTLRIPVSGTIPAIDPGLAKAPASVEVAEQLFLGLTDMDPETYQAVPELAEKWTVSEDGRNWRFELRKDAIWTDGSPVTAHDVTWAVHRNLRSGTKSPCADMLYILKNAETIHKTVKPENGTKGTSQSEIQIPDKNTEKTEDMRPGVRAVDDFTVEFTLEYPASFFPVIAGFPVYRPLPKEAMEKYGDEWTEPGNIRTNGAYGLALWEKNGLMILRKNPKYYDAKNVSVQEIRYYMIQKSSVGLAMYESDALDIMGGSYLPIPITDLHRIRTESALSSQYSYQPKLCTYAYAFDTVREPVDNLLVRKAISAAIDRETLIRMVTRGSQEPALTFVPPPAFGAVTPMEKTGIRFNPPQAREWLALAGYPDGNGFPEITLTYENTGIHPKIARAVQTFLKYYLNITIKLDEKEEKDYAKALAQSRTICMFRYSGSGDYPDADNWLYERFHPYFSPNRTKWKNVSFANLTDLARAGTDLEERNVMINNPRRYRADAGTDHEERNRLYRLAEQILIEEAVVLPIFFETAPTLVKPRVKGWYNMAAGGQHIRNWRLAE
ncbi:ABC transporter substrate-binding protein [Desulfococcaceae bacterium HSG8]|nr:ABC transporter substrate-binding protein [Desulfococcaceae bacterium HSG8]